MAKKQVSNLFKFKTCYTSNITGQKICMPERTHKEAMTTVRGLRADNKAHKRAENFVLWKNIRVSRR